MFYYIDTLQRLVGDARNCCNVMRNLISLLLFSFHKNPKHRHSWYMFNTCTYIHGVSCLQFTFAKSDILAHCIIHLVVIVTQTLHAKQLFKINLFCASWNILNLNIQKYEARITSTDTCSSLAAVDETQNYVENIFAAHSYWTDNKSINIYPNSIFRCSHDVANFNIHIYLILLINWCK